MLPAGELKPLVEELIRHPSMVGYSVYLNRIQIFWSNEIPTACAGHGFIFFNKIFYYSIPKPARVTVLAHEIMHLILRHLDRGKQANASTYNIAADHVINTSLKHDGFSFVGLEDCICDMKYSGWSTEDVYNVLAKNPPPPPPNTPSADQIEDLIKDALKKMAEAGEVSVSFDEQVVKAEGDLKDLETSIGSNPGMMTRVMLNSTRAVIIEDATYQEIFSDYLIDPLNLRRRTFSRPSRRFKSQNFVLPGRLKKQTPSNRLTHLVYALDVSGSINAQQAQQFHDSVRTIKKLLDPEALTVLFFDTKIVLERVFKSSEPYTEIQVRAGGGTHLGAVYKRTEELEPEALVVFTDLAVKIPTKMPCKDVIWIVPFLVNTKVPYGTTYLIPKLEQ